MSNNLAIKDGGGTTRTVATKDNANVHYPKHIWSADDGSDALTALLNAIATATGQDTGNASLAAILAALSGNLVVSPSGGEIAVRTAVPAAPTAAQIANGASLTSAIDLGNERLHRILIPAAWTTAAITFQSSTDGSNFFDLCNESGEYALNSTVVAAGRAIVLDQAIFYGVRYLKIRSGTSSAAVNQGADRNLVLVTVPR